MTTPALVLVWDTWTCGQVRMPPPWFVESDEPACGAELNIRPEFSVDGVEGRYACDRPIHAEGERHRAVIDRIGGEVFEWTTRQ